MAQRNLSNGKFVAGAYPVAAGASRAASRASLAARQTTSDGYMPSGAVGAGKVVGDIVQVGKRAAKRFVAPVKKVVKQVKIGYRQGLRD